MSASRRLRRMAGLTMVELVMFIVIVGVAVAGVLSVLNVTTRYSADPQMRKQALAVAEALLEEVAMMPFTVCDPDDPNAATAAVPANCTGGADGPNDQTRLPLGPQADEARASLTTPFDNVADYNGFTLAAGGTDIGGLVTTPAGYAATVVVAQDAFGPAAAQVPAAEGLRITVTVTYNGGRDNIVLEGYRAQYAPGFLP